MTAARISLVALAALLAAVESPALTDAELTAIRDGFTARRDTAIEALRGQPYKPRAKQEPLGPGRALFTRDFSYAILSFAFRAMWNGEQLEAANAALDENSAYYLAHPAAFADRDSFYWGADILCRIVEFFGRHGSLAPGRLAAASEDQILAMMWAYAKDYSKLPDAEFAQSQTWHVWESENHHIQKFSALWQFSRLLAREPSYQARAYADGQPAAAHYEAWTSYAKEYCRERGRRGLFVKANGDYGVTREKDLQLPRCRRRPQLRDLRGIADLFWATGRGATDGVGRAKPIYRPNAAGRDELTTSPLYLGALELTPPSNHFFTILSSAYRLPLVVLDLALDPAGRGVYAIRQRTLGAAEPGFFQPPDYHLETTNGGLVRYSWCTPEFIMGLPLLAARPLEDWTMISSQNRWQGVIFAGHPDARLMPQCKSKDGRTTYNQMWGVQSRGSMLAQRLPDPTTRNTGGMQIYFSPQGLSNRVESDGWVFCEAPGAYAAARPARGGYTWQPETAGAPWMAFTDGMSPAVLEVARKSDFPDYAAFQAAVTALPMTWHGQTLTYHGISGDRLTLPADTPRAEMMAAPRPRSCQIFDKPFIQSAWGTGQVTIAKSGRTLQLDFH